MAPARLFCERLIGAAALVIAAFSALAAPTPAHAQTAAEAQTARRGWVVCNYTRFVLEAAVGRPQGGKTTVDGWIRMRPGECRVAAGAPLARERHFLFAQTSSAHRGGRRQWGGPFELCVDTRSSFSVESARNCAAMGLDARGFRGVAIANRDSWTTYLGESENFNQQSARAAGIRQLLGDAGYDAPGFEASLFGTGGGGLPRFKSDNKIPPNASDEAVIDALESAARKRRAQVGLVVCNRTKERVWAAIAQRRAEGFESRGWWGLAPGGCARAINDRLAGQPYYVYGVMETLDGDVAMAVGREAFCVGRARFAIAGRDNCAARQYQSVQFLPISPQPGREAMTYEFRPEAFGIVAPDGQSGVVVSQPPGAPAPAAAGPGARGSGPSSALPASPDAPRNDPAPQPGVRVPPPPATAPNRGGGR